ncbi:MAG: flagellar filament capping protein FliD [Steroidobacteraceae bacterium]|jgi:flagellar hook-associated protein 2|nr:flagellar filament capping protein FliD [Steroidobacteraceae bacterium]
MSIIASGIGSGLDIDGIVRQLLAAEGQPQQQRLDQRQSSLQARLSAFGQFRSAIEALREALRPLTSLDGFQGRTAVVASEALLGASATLEAAPGSYTVEVLQLAAAQKLASGPFASAQDVVGNGTLTLAVGGESFDVVIEPGRETLADIRSAINAATGNSGVTATLVNASDGTRLVLTAAQSGAASTISVSASGGDGGLAALTTLTEVQPARDAQLRVDGFTINSATNVVSDAVSGLTLALKSAAPGSPTTVTVGNDAEGSRAKVDGFVQAYNALVNALRPLTAFNADTGTRGPLLGDPTARNFLNAVRTEVVRAVAGGGSVGSLAELGITTRADGTLSIDATRLGEALAGRFEDVGRFFSAGETGLAGRLDALLGQYVGSDGLIKARTDGLQARLRDVADARTALEFRLEKIEARLRREFGALDSLVAQLRQTSDFLTRQLATLTPTNQQR